MFWVATQKAVERRKNRSGKPLRYRFSQLPANHLVEQFHIPLGRYIPAEVLGHVPVLQLLEACGKLIETADELAVKLETARAALLAECELLSQMYDKNLDHYKLHTMYILAGKMRLARDRASKSHRSGILSFLDGRNRRFDLLKKPGCGIS